MYKGTLKRPLWTYIWAPARWRGRRHMTKWCRAWRRTRKERENPRHFRSTQKTLTLTWDQINTSDFRWIQMTQRPTGVNPIDKHQNWQWEQPGLLNRCPRGVFASVSSKLHHWFWRLVVRACRSSCARGWHAQPLTDWPAGWLAGVLRRKGWVRPLCPRPPSSEARRLSRRSCRPRGPSWSSPRRSEPRAPPRNETWGQRAERTWGLCGV